jgi:hypothetical protein
MFSPGTFDNACLQKENETKPKITLKLEVSDPMVSAEQGTTGLFEDISQARW